MRQPLDTRRKRKVERGNQKDGCKNNSITGGYAQISKQIKDGINENTITVVTDMRQKLT